MLAGSYAALFAVAATQSLVLFAKDSASIGSNAWGTWETTPDGLLPAVRYLGPSNESQSGSLLHQFGNDRLVAVAAANGLISIRQDEGGPKLLHGLDEQSRQFRGGAGWIAEDGKIAASSRCPSADTDGGKCSNLDIWYGVGLASKATATASMPATAGDRRLSHAVQAPFGDFPFVVSEVNATTSSASATYTEIWSTLAEELLHGGRDTYASRTWKHNVTASCLAMAQGASAAARQSSSADSSNSSPSDHVVLEPARLRDRGGPLCPSGSLGLLLLDTISAGGPAAADGGQEHLEANASRNDRSQRMMGTDDEWPSHFPKSATRHDENPRPIFLVLFSRDRNGSDFAGCSLSTNSTSVYPDTARPDEPAVTAPLDNVVTGEEEGHPPVLAIQTPLGPFQSAHALSDGSSSQLYLASGYLPPGAGSKPADVAVALQAVFAAQASPGGLRGWLSSSSRKFAGTGIRFQPDPSAEPEAAQWAAREQTWQAGYTRGAMSYDSFWQGFLINQAGVYQYYHGFQGAIRDPLAHVAPLVFNSHFYPGQINRSSQYSGQRGQFPESALGQGSSIEMVRFSVQQADAAWTMPYGLQAFGWVFKENYTSPAGKSMHPSDLEIWTLGAAARYVLSTRDAAPMIRAVSRNISIHGEPGPAGAPGVGARVALHEALWALYQRLVQIIGTGQNGLLHMLHMDHNDGICRSTGLSEAQCTALVTEGETVMSTAMAGYMLPQFADALRLTAETQNGHSCSDQPEQLLCTRAAAADTYAASLVQAMNKVAVNTDQSQVPLYYRRAWISPTYGWIGCSVGSCPAGVRSNDSAVWLEPNAWALLAGGPEHYSDDDSVKRQFTQSVLDSIETGLRADSPIGTHFANQSYATWHGNGHYANVWPCGIMPYVEALGARGLSDTAWDEVKKNAFATHAQVYPNIMAGTWTGSDSYMRPGQPTSGEGGVSDWQLHNIWSHAAPQLRLPSIVGAVFGSDYLQVSARLEKQSNWAFSSALLNVSRSTEACSDTSVAPSRSGPAVGSATAMPSASVSDRVCIRGEWAPVTLGACPSVVVLLRDGEPARVSSFSINGVAARWEALPASGGLPNRIRAECDAWAAAPATSGMQWSVQVN